MDIDFHAPCADNSDNRQVGIPTSSLKTDKIQTYHSSAEGGLKVEERLVPEILGYVDAKLMELFK